MEENAVRHVSLLTKVVNAHERKLSELTRELEGVRARDGVMLWRVDGVRALLAEGKLHPGYELRGPPFYHGRHGYRLAPSLFPGGEGSGEASHLSLYVRLLPGDYDGILTWPFQLPVTLRLVDQSPEVTSRKHRTESFTPNPSWQHFRCPSRSSSPWSSASSQDSTSGREKSPLGFGYPRFISLETLKSGNYVKDDVMFGQLAMNFVTMRIDRFELKRHDCHRKDPVFFSLFI